MSNNVENQPDGTGGDAYGFLRTLTEEASQQNTEAIQVWIKALVTSMLTSCTPM